MVDAAHFGVDLAEDLGALLEAEDDVLLDEGKLDGESELLELLELGVCLGEEGFLVFLAAEGEEGAFLVADGEHLFGDLGFFVGEEGYAALVLVEFVALGFEVEDCPDWGGC